MTTTKTAISLPELLFKRANALAEELKISRSQLFSLAVEEFIERYQNQKLLETLNDVYQEGPDDAELQLLRETKPKYRRLLEDEW